MNFDNNRTSEESLRDINMQIYKLYDAIDGITEKLDELIKVLEKNYQIKEEK